MCSSGALVPDGCGFEHTAPQQERGRVVVGAAVPHLLDLDRPQRDGRRMDAQVVLPGEGAGEAAADRGHAVELRDRHLHQQVFLAVADGLAWDVVQQL